MQISYHSFLTKIQKLQNLKKKKKKIYVPAGIARYWPVRPVFLPVRNVWVNRTGSPAGTVLYQQHCFRFKIFKLILPNLNDGHLS